MHANTCTHTNHHFALTVAAGAPATLHHTPPCQGGQGPHTCTQNTCMQTHAHTQTTILLLLLQLERLQPCITPLPAKEDKAPGPSLQQQQRDAEEVWRKQQRKDESERHAAAVAAAAAENEVSGCDCVCSAIMLLLRRHTSAVNAAAAAAAAARMRSVDAIVKCVV